MNPRLLLPALIALNVVVKLLWLGTNELAHDEPFTVYWSQQPLAAFWTMLGTENNPPFYFLLIKAWSLFTPLEAAWLRVPSAIFSALTVWPLFLLARQLGGTRTALVASLLFTFTNYHYGFAHEVRAYSLFALLATTGMWLLWRAANRPRHGLRAMLALGALNALLVYTHFFGWLAIGVQALCVLLLPELRPLRRHFFLGAALTLVLFAPYLATFALRMGSSVAHGTWLEAPVPEELYNMLWRWSNQPVFAIGFLVLILTACGWDRLRSVGLRVGVLWAFLPLLGMFAVSYAVPVFLDRYLVYAAPGFALLVAASIGALRIPAAGKSALAATVVLGMGATFTPWAQGRYHPSGVVAQADAWKRGVVLIQPSWYELTYLWAEDDHDCFLAPNEELQWCMGRGSTWSLNGAEELPIDPEAEEQVVLVDATGHSEEDRSGVKDRLRSALPKVDSVEADHRVWVYRFSR